MAFVISTATQLTDNPTSFDISGLLPTTSPV
ncbi:hypothetical protein FGIG_09589 [Fasciola gigantica]|uniref:Uncharacterized protein n=1 Tax=Fasciola gigantica TaxID=46835 RepID=A0A504YR24_FASGI|nr:hypothetical protein FGIG_09589 [Fasciola gigantica]